MKCHLILNPRSNSGRAEKKFETIFRLLSQAGIGYQCSYAQTYSAIFNAAVEAHAGEHDAIVAVGGDGTINAVMNSFYCEDGTLRSEKRMGVIYTGTSPDFCRSYGIPLDLEKAVETLWQSNVRKIKVGRINFRLNLESSMEETRYFSCCASIGIGAMVADKANRIRKYLGDTVGTLAAILDSLIKFHPYDITLDTMNEEKKFSRVTNIFIGRTKYIASGLQVRHEMADDDERFYLLCVKSLNLWRLPGLLRQLYTGDTRNSKAMEVFYAERIRVGTKQPALVEFDGDPAGFTPCNIEPSLYPLKLLVLD